MGTFQKGNPGGPGRPRKAEKYAAPIAAAEDRIADRLPERVERLEQLANGGYEQVETVWKPAGLIFVGSGEWATLAFPHLPPEQLVCVERKVSIAAPDRAANIYLIDRIAGRPAQRVDLDADPEGTLELTAEVMSQAARELAEWRRQMTEQLSGPNAPPTPPTPATPTESSTTPRSTATAAA